jgi:hypothetical protein
MHGRGAIGALEYICRDLPHARKFAMRDQWLDKQLDPIS